MRLGNRRAWGGLLISPRKASAKRMCENHV